MSDWDILNLGESWPHVEIQQRLHNRDIDCYFVDMFDDGIAWIVGCWMQRAEDIRIADALNIPKEVLYMDWEHGIVFINLYQLKAIRNGVEL